MQKSYQLRIMELWWYLSISMWCIGIRTDYHDLISGDRAENFTFKTLCARYYWLLIESGQLLWTWNKHCCIKLLCVEIIVIFNYFVYENWFWNLRMKPKLFEVLGFTQNQIDASKQTFQFSTVAVVLHL